MSPEPLWERVSDLFEQALERPRTQRTGWLQQICGQDAALHAEVESLLRAHDKAEGVLDQSMQLLASEAWTEAQHPAAENEQVGPYRIIGEIGRGGMGVVYKAEDPRLGRYVALKFLPPYLTANDKAKRRLLAEARAASVLDHPNICTIHDIGETPEGRLFIAMAFYEGQTLAERIEAGAFPAEEARRIVCQAARGLEHAHETGVVHRDIKPSNIFVTSRGDVKILDFGLAKLHLTPLTDSARRAGTVWYMSPEQAQGKDIDHRTDLWSLGATLYEMLSGRRPFSGDYEASILYEIVHENPAPLDPAVPEWLRDVVARLLAKQPEQRFSGASELLAAVEAKESSRPAKPMEETMVGRATTARPSSRGSAARELVIRFCASPDGARIAYGTVGEGPALVCPPGWISHLQDLWQEPRWRAFYETLAADRTVVLYDKHGTGLSDRNRTDFTLEAELRDLTTVVDHLDLHSFALFGNSPAAAVSAAFAARHPERVTHLVLCGSFARGAAISPPDLRNSLYPLIRAHWGIGSRVVADILLPGADPAALEHFTALQRSSASPDMACKLLQLIYELDVSSLLPTLDVPTLVLHRKKDEAIRFELGREVAALIPRARFVPLEGRVHFPWLGDAASILQATAEFLQEARPRTSPPSDSSRRRSLSSALAAAQASRELPAVSATAPGEPAPGMLRNFPGILTSFIGREREMEALKALLDSTRVLTLTGPGGTGKTRLGLHVASAVAASFVDGAYFIPLAAIRDPNLFPAAIARGVGVLEIPGTPPLDTLKQTLGPKRMLLLLDNFEQILDAGPAVAELLAACPAIKVLVTSRAPLRVRGEQEYPVPPLEVPANRDRLSLETLERHSAVRLFVERARAARPDFTLTAGNAADIAEVCARLDGLPLAIELAAARIKLFSPYTLLARLGQRLDLLKGGARDLPVRHQALRQAIAWSYDLLDPGAQRLFRRLSIFAGGWTFEACEALCSGDPECDAFDLLATLVDQSLVRRLERPTGEPRFFMLETIRAFGQEILEQQGEVDEVSGVHARYFLDLAERAEPELTGAQQARWLDSLEAEHYNFRAAFRWTQLSGEVLAGIRLGAALWRFWVARGHIDEGLPLLDDLLQRQASGDDEQVRVRGLHGLATLHHYRGEMVKARETLEQCAELSRRRGDKPGIAMALTTLGWVHCELSQLRTAQAICEEALALHEELRDKRGVALVLNNFGWIANYAGDYPQAHSFHERSLALRREIGDQRGIAFALTNLAWAERYHGEYLRSAALIEEAVRVLRPLNDRVLLDWAVLHLAQLARDQGHGDRAFRLLEEHLALRPTFGHPSILAFAHTQLGALLHDQGEFDRAQGHFDHGLATWKRVHSPWGVAANLYEQARAALTTDHRKAAGLLCESLKIRSEVGDRRGVAECLEALADTTPQRQPLQPAVILLTAAETIRENTASRPNPRRRMEIQRRWDAIRTALPPTLVEDLRQRALSMSLEQAVAFALERGLRAAPHD